MPTIVVSDYMRQSSPLPRNLLWAADSKAKNPQFAVLTIPGMLIWHENENSIGNMFPISVSYLSSPERKLGGPSSPKD